MITKFKIFENINTRIINSNSFKEWFGNSKTIKDSVPFIFYHGTNAVFNEFANPRRGAFGLVFYFTTDIKEAKGYGKRLLKLYLKLENPATPKEIQNIILNIPDRKYMDDYELATEISKCLKENGFDGILFDYPNGDLLAMVLNPNQIKLADGTNTTFDKNNPDTTK